MRFVSAWPVHTSPLRHFLCRSGFVKAVADDIVGSVNIDHFHVKTVKGGSDDRIQESVLFRFPEFDFSILECHRGHKSQENLVIQIFYQQGIVFLAFSSSRFRTQWAFKAAMKTVAASITTKLEMVKALTSTKGLSF